MQVRLSETYDGFTDNTKVSDNGISKYEGTWNDETEELKPCWSKPDLGAFYYLWYFV